MMKRVVFFCFFDFSYYFGSVDSIFIEYSSGGGGGDEKLLEEVRKKKKNVKVGGEFLFSLVFLNTIEFVFNYYNKKTLQNHLFGSMKHFHRRAFQHEHSMQKTQKSKRTKAIPGCGGGIDHF